MTNAEKCRRLANFLEEMAQAEEYGREYEIQARGYKEDSEWTRIRHKQKKPTIAFFPLMYEYRIVYKPRKLWANVYGPPDSSSKLFIHTTKEIANEQASNTRTALICLVEDTENSQYFDKESDDEQKEQPRKEFYVNKYANGWGPMYSDINLATRQSDNPGYEATHRFVDTGPVN